MSLHAVAYGSAGRRSSAPPLSSVLLLGIGVVCWLHPVGEGLQVATLLVATAVLGGPHGIYDLPLILEASHGRRGRLFVFLGAYLVLALAMVLAWRVAPSVALIAFLGVAAAHFGEDFVNRTRGSGAAQRLQQAAGGLGVLLPLLFLHPLALASWVAATAGDRTTDVARTLQRLAPLALSAWSVLTGASLILSLRRGDGARAMTLTALVSLFLAAPPLLAFAAYFALDHSLRHVLESEPAGSRRWRTRLAWLIPAAVCTTAVILVLVRTRGQAFATVYAMRLLAALAAPHLLLGPWLKRAAAAVHAQDRPWEARRSYPRIGPRLTLPGAAPAQS